MVPFHTLLAIATLITHATAIPSPKASTTTSATSSCPTAFVAKYEDINIPQGSAGNVPTPYLMLNYVGWTVSSPLDAAGVVVSGLQTVSPPKTIFFNGNDDTRVHSLSTGNGVTYFNLTSLYIGCATVVGAGTVVGTANAPTGCTVQAVGTTLAGSMVSADLIFVQDTNHALFTFPRSFARLRTVNFVLTATAATSGLTAVDFDNVAYTVETCWVVCVGRLVAFSLIGEDEAKGL